MGIDSQVVTYLGAHRSWFFDQAALATMFIGTNRLTVAVLALGSLAIVIRLRTWRVAAVVGLALTMALSASEVLKDLITRGRPPASLALVDVTGSSMPSTDAALSAAVAVAIFFAVDWPTLEIRRLAAMVAMACVFWIGICLVYLGVHWPTDVLAGWLLGGGIGLAAAWVGRRLRRAFPRQQSNETAR